MATEDGCIADTETPSSPSTDFNSMSQPLVIDCPDPESAPSECVMDSIQSGSEPSKDAQNGSNEVSANLQDQFLGQSFYEIIVETIGKLVYFLFFHFCHYFVVSRK